MTYNEIFFLNASLMILTAENWRQGFSCNIVETFQITSTLRQSNGNNYNSKGIPLSFETVENNLMVFPNPAKDEINLKFGKDDALGEAIIFNQMGQIVKRTPVTDHPISISELPAGIYFVKVGSESVRFLRSR